MSNTASKTSCDSQAAKFAVVRLKPGDNLLGLFQLLIYNGFGEVSFVNNLSETIFPAIGNGGAKLSSSPEPISKNGENTGGGAVQVATEKATNGSPDRMDMTKGGNEKLRISNISAATERFQLPPPQASLPLRTQPIENRMWPPAEPILAQKVISDQGISEDLALNRAKRNPLDLNLIPQTTAAASGSTTLATFANMQSSFLGLPTMPSLNTSAAAAAAIAALSEAATPPYSLANFFTPNSLATSIPSVALLPPQANGSVHQYSPALLAAAAAAQQQRQAANMVPTSTAPSSIPPRPRSPNLQTLSQLNRSALPPQPQQRIHMNQPSYPFQHQFGVQPRLAFPHQQQQQQPAKLTQQKSPPAPSPGSSSSNSSNSSQTGINCAPMPPGCATTQLRQRGQRSYAEDPSLYVACRLCKNKIMGSRISNLTNHVRRHSSMKQFQCCYCDYTHNEMAKVRLHMLHNHKDKDSQPIDNLSPEMQASWDLLMKECFPDHCQQQQQQPQLANSGSPPQQQAANPGMNTGTVASMISQHLQLQCQPPSASAVTNLRGELSLQQIAYNPAARNRSESASNGSIETVSPHEEKNFERNLQVLVQRRDEENVNNASPTSSTSTSSVVSAEATTPPANQNQSQQPVARCIECGTFVNAKMKARHIRKCHLQCLLPFVCSMCGYDHSEHSKVKLHICLKHDDDPMAQVVTRDVATYAEQFVPDYFPHTQVQCANNGHTPTSQPVATCPPAEVTASQQVETESAIVYMKPQSDLHSPKKCTRLVTCVVCRRSIQAAKAIHHARKHVSASRYVYACTVCNRYKTGSRIRIRWHMSSKHNQKDGKVLIYKHAPTAAGGGMGKRAVGRCFPAANKIAWISKCAKAVIGRCRFQYERKRCLRKISIRKTAARMRTMLKSRHSKKHLPPTSELSNGTHFVPPTILTKNPVIKSEPKMELQTSNGLESTTAPTDLFRMCPLCARWIRSDQLTGHLQSHVPSMGAAYRCNLCEYTASDALLVRAHFLQEHQKVQVQQQQSAHDGHQAPLLMTYAILCRGSSSTATAADG